MRTCVWASRRISTASKQLPRTARWWGRGIRGCTNRNSASQSGTLRWRSRSRLRCRATREIAILVTGTAFHSAYELYAHVIAGEQRGLSDDKIAMVVAGHRPSDLTNEEAVAHDVA